uniref:F-box domain-containing protein n=1 Tax=Parascaris univalens TaxID=6257 RepID=A0A915B4L6_PARUN
MYRIMNYQHSGSSSSSNSHHYNLRSRNSNIVTNNRQSTRINHIVESTKITDYFVVRKRRSISSDEESDMETSKKRVKNEADTSNDQVVPEVGYSVNHQSHMSRRCRFAILKNLPENPLGIFATLSPEIFLTIIERIPVARLVSLAETSLEMNSLLRCYATSGTAGKRFVKETAVIRVPLNVQMTNEDPFYAWGMLLKSVTITESASKRIDYFGIFYARYRNRCDEAGWGRCIMAFLKQWDFCECARLLHSLFSTTESGLYRTILETLDEPDGLHPDKEMKIRRRLKNLFLSHQYPDIRDASFWLSAILRTHLNTTKQAKLLYILFGPTRLNDFLQEVIDWRDLCEIPVSTLVSSKQKLGPLSDALLTLLQTKCLGNSEFVYNEADMFNILEELTTYPQPWPFDNFVALLLNRTALIPIALAFRMMHGYVEETGQMFNSMRLLLYRWHLPVVRYLERPMRQTMITLQRFQRVALMRSILMAQFDATAERLDELPGRQQEFLEELQATAVTSPLLRLLGMML